MPGNTLLLVQQANQHQPYRVLHTSVKRDNAYTRVVANLDSHLIAFGLGTAWKMRGIEYIRAQNIAMKCTSLIFCRAKVFSGHKCQIRNHALIQTCDKITLHDCRKKSREARLAHPEICTEAIISLEYKHYI